MTKRSVSPQAKSESNKRQREEQATDGTSHSNNQLAQASVKDLTKHGLMGIETKDPGSIRGWTMAAVRGHTEALNSIAPILKQLTKNELLTIETKAPGTIGNIAFALNLATTVGLLSKEELIDIETKAPGTIGNIAKAAAFGENPIALNNIATTVGLLSKDKILDIETKAPGTIGNIARAAACNNNANIGENPIALSNIADALGQLTKDELIVIESDEGGTISLIAYAAGVGKNPTPLNNIATALGQLTKDELIAIESNFPDTIHEISFAASEGYPSALNNIAVSLGQLTKIEDLAYENLEETIESMACAALKGHPDALNSIANILGQLDITELDQDITKRIIEVAVAGHPKAFLAILDYFFIVENNKPKCNLPKCIKDSIRQGEYGRGLSFVMVAAEIKKRYPSCFDKVCTNNKFRYGMEWYDSITALDKFGDILDYIKKTVLKYNTQDAARCSIEFISKLIEFYEESNPIVCNESDLNVFIQKIMRYKSQYANVIHSDKKSVERQLEDFMTPIGQHVVASISLFSESYCSLRAKYKTLVGINKSAGGLLHLEQFETLSDAHNEIVALFRHFILCLKDDLSASQMTFCYDDIDNFLRCYDYGEARQLLLDDLQHLDRHHPQHALFKAQS